MSCTHYAHILKCCTLEFFLLAAGYSSLRALQAQTLKTLYTFTGGADGVGPFDSLILKGQQSLWRCSRWERWRWCGL